MPFFKQFSKVCKYINIQIYISLRYCKMSIACIQLGFEKICMIQSLSTVYGYIEALRTRIGEKQK